MQKLIKIILENKFPDTNIEQLQEIINATPNPIVATEILCGVYEEPECVIQSSNNRLSGVKDTVRTFVSYDKWAQEIKYRYTHQETTYAFVAEKKDVYTKEDIIKEYYDFPNGAERREYEEQYHVTHVPIKIVVRENTCDIKDWK